MAKGTTPVYKQKITEPLLEESLPYDYSPEQHLASSEGEAPLIKAEPEDDLTMSPPYIKAPLEDRSKYEKLTQGIYDVTSDSNSEEEVENFKLQDKTKKKRKINIPEKLHSVYKTVEMPIKSFRSERNKPEEKANKDKKKSHKKDSSVDIDSDDSIGSASDLRVDEDMMEGIPIKEDTISETISESIKTCGSSAYHAECESMATHEEDCTSRIIRTKQREEAKKSAIQSEDMLFVGHQYGEKPLLMDDELDSDCEIKFDPKWTPNKDQRKKADIWIAPSSSFEDHNDVFAMAPFGKAKAKNEEINSKDTFEIEHEDKTSPVVIQSFESESFADFSACNDISGTNDPVQTANTICLNPFLNTEFPTSTVAQSVSHYGTVTVNSNFINIEVPSQSTDYFSETKFESNFADADPYFSNPKEEVIYENVNIPEKGYFMDLLNPHEFRLQKLKYPKDTDDFSMKSSISLTFPSELIRSDSQELSQKVKKDKKER
ncbi:hypothetical protein NQ314_009391 [Rhamnusium bicolor]|uniref:Uncharacterized protein n=1 Tax=Rhamnusium bicolor TaxID=1586634 RepID=A0AAV8Y020_9CUCU|nr:hypothetical protein NQ314_009391 [Rhamnusium bicolor]